MNLALLPGDQSFSLCGDFVTGVPAMVAPVAPRVHTTMFIFGQAEGRLDAAAQRLEAARALSPLDVEITMDLARLRLAQGRRSDAAGLLARALELEPEHPGLAELRRELGGS